MDDLVRKLQTLEVDDRRRETVDKPKLPKGKRTAYIFFRQQYGAVLNGKRDKHEKLGLGQLSKLCSQRWKVCLSFFCNYFVVI